MEQIKLQEEREEQERIMEQIRKEAEKEDNKDHFYDVGELHEVFFSAVTVPNRRPMNCSRFCGNQPILK